MKRASTPSPAGRSAFSSRYLSFFAGVCDALTKVAKRKLVSLALDGFILSLFSLTFPFAAFVRLATAARPSESETSPGPGDFCFHRGVRVLSSERREPGSIGTRKIDRFRERVQELSTLDEYYLVGFQSEESLFIFNYSFQPLRYGPIFLYRCS